MKQSGSSQKSKESKYFDELRNENYDNSFPAAESWLRNTNVNLLNKKSEGKFKMKFKNYFATNKFKLAYTFLILAFVVAACNYPVTQEETAGDVLKWTVSKNNTETINKIENSDWFKSGEYNINEENGIVSYSLVVPKEKHAGIQDINKQLSAMEGVMEVNIIPINETVKRPLYSAVLNDLFKIDINATNMSDAELNNEINAQLKKAGIENATVNFEKGPDGKRLLKVGIPDDQMHKSGGFDMTVQDGNNLTKLKEVRKNGPGDPDKFKGKSDDDIRAMVRADLQIPDLRNDEIEIIRKGDNVMVKVNRKVEKTDGSNKEKIEMQQEIK